MPSCGGRDLVPSRRKRAGNLLYVRYSRSRAALLALPPFTFPVARHPLVACYAERRADRLCLPERDNLHLLQVNAAFLETPDRDHLIARQQLPDDMPEIFCGLVGHAPNGKVPVFQDERDVPSRMCPGK